MAKTDTVSVTVTDSNGDSQVIGPFSITVYTPPTATVTGLPTSTTVGAPVSGTVVPSVDTALTVKTVTATLNGQPLAVAAAAPYTFSFTA